MGKLVLLQVIIVVLGVKLRVLAMVIVLQMDGGVEIVMHLLLDYSAGYQNQNQSNGNTGYGNTGYGNTNTNASGGGRALWAYNKPTSLSSSPHKSTMASTSSNVRCNSHEGKIIAGRQIEQESLCWR